MTARIAAVLLMTLCLAVPVTAQEQSPRVEQPVAGPRHNPLRPTLHEAASREGMRLATAGADRVRQTPAARRKSSAVAVGALIGGLAGGAGGLLQPTHSNGEYVLGNSRAVSALSLGAIGAGVGALTALAVDKMRR